MFLYLKIVNDYINIKHIFNVYTQCIYNNYTYMLLRDIYMYILSMVVNVNYIIYYVLYQDASNLFLVILSKNNLNIVCL